MPISDPARVRHVADHDWSEDADQATAGFARLAAVRRVKNDDSGFGCKALGDSPLTGITRKTRGSFATPGRQHA